MENQITELAAHIHAANFRLLELIREFDEHEGWAGDGIRSCAHWLNWKVGTSLGAAREKVRVAHALKDLSKISAEFRKGRLSYSKVRAMTRVANVENEDYLLMIARHGTTAHMERLVRGFRKVKRIEALERDKARHLARNLSWYIDDDGMWVFRGRFTPEQGALLEKALGAVMDEMSEEQEDVSAETPDEETVERPVPIASRRADALARLAEAGLSGGTTESSTGDRYLVHIHTDTETLKADGQGAESQLEGGANVSAETSRRIACDAGLVHWKEGKSLNIGRKSRTVPPSIQRALRRRDGGCRFPGCTARRFVDAHHGEPLIYSYGVPLQFDSPASKAPNAA